MNIGISCRVVFKTVFFIDNKLLGYYGSDIAIPKRIKGNQLIWEYESGKSTVMDLSDKVPNEFEFGEIKRRLIKN